MSALALIHLEIYDMRMTKSNLNSPLRVKPLSTPHIKLPFIINILKNSKNRIESSIFLTHLTQNQPIKYAKKIIVKITSGNIRSIKV